MGRAPPIGPPGASCGLWRPSGQRSRTSPKPRFQNPSIAGWDCVPAFWDSVGRERAGGHMWGDDRPRAGALTTFPQQNPGHRHARLGAPDWAARPVGSTGPPPGARPPNPPSARRPLARLPVLPPDFFANDAINPEPIMWAVTVGQSLSGAFLTITLGWKGVANAKEGFQAGATCTRSPPCSAIPWSRRSSTARTPPSAASAARPAPPEKRPVAPRDVPEPRPGRAAPSAPGARPRARPGTPPPRTA